MRRVHTGERVEGANDMKISSDKKRNDRKYKTNWELDDNKQWIDKRNLGTTI